MQISELKKGFWGYRKEDVYQYISTLNEEFSKKLLEKDEKTEGLLQSLQAKNAALEQELVTLKQENEKYEKMYFAVSDSIINAQSYAVQLKNETKEKEQALREQLEAEITSQHLKLESYVEQIKSLRAHLKCVLEDMDTGLQSSQIWAKKLAGTNPIAIDDTENTFVQETDEALPAGESENSELQHNIPADRNMSLFQKKDKK